MKLRAEIAFIEEWTLADPFTMHAPDPFYERNAADPDVRSGMILEALGLPVMEEGHD